MRNSRNFLSWKFLPLKYNISKTDLKETRRQICKYSLGMFNRKELSLFMVSQFEVFLWWVIWHSHFFLPSKNVWRFIYDFVRIVAFPAILYICGLEAGLDFNINLLTFIRSFFFCKSMVSSINFNSPVWKCCY